MLRFFTPVIASLIIGCLAIEPIIASPLGSDFLPVSAPQSDHRTFCITQALAAHPDWVAAAEWHPTARVQGEISRRAVVSPLLGWFSPSRPNLTVAILNGGTMRNLGVGRTPQLTEKTDSGLVIRGWKPGIRMSEPFGYDVYSMQRIGINEIRRLLFAAALNSYWQRKFILAKIVWAVEFGLFRKSGIPIHVYDRGDDGPLAVFRSGYQHLALGIAQELEEGFGMGFSDQFFWQPGRVANLEDPTSVADFVRLMTPLLSVMEFIFEYELDHWHFITRGKFLSQVDEFLRIRKALSTLASIRKDPRINFFLDQNEGLKALRAFWTQELDPINPLRGRTRRQAMWNLAGRISASA